MPVINALRVNGRPIMQRKPAPVLTLRDVVLDALRTINSHPPLPCCDSCASITDTIADRGESTEIIESTADSESTDNRESTVVAESTDHSEPSFASEHAESNEAPELADPKESTECHESSATVDAFAESDHPRDEGGQFSFNQSSTKLHDLVNSVDLQHLNGRKQVVPLSKITATIPAVMSERNVKRLQQAYTQGQEVPPPKLLHHNGEYALIDGHHRVEALHRNGNTSHVHAVVLQAHKHFKLPVGDAFKEEQHPRGEGEHGGQFVKKGTGTSTKSNESTATPKSSGTHESVTYSKTTKPPAELHGVAFKSWTPPESNDQWETLAGDGIAEPSLPPTETYKDDKGKQHSKKWGAGVIVQEPDGRVWLIKPKNEYGGYKHTWLKGTVEPEMSFQATAIKEAYEETGLHVELTEYADDVSRDTSVARYYFAKRVGGTPADAGWEAEGVALVDPSEIKKYLNRSVDRKMAAKLLKPADTKQGTKEPESTEVPESKSESKSTEAHELKLSDMKKIGSQLGSNPGGKYEDKQGNKYYIKLSKSPDHAKNEILASRLYEAAGAPILKALPVDMDGKLGTATEWVSGVKNIDHNDKTQIKEAQKYFAVHAWLANWDAAGLEYDNQGVVNGKMTTLDPGGSLLYRAQGGPKGDAFGDKVTEWNSLRSPSNAQANKIFGDMTNSQLKQSAQLVAKVSDATIRDLVSQQGPGTPHEKSKLSDRLIKRKADIVAKASATHDVRMPRLFIDVNLNGRHERVTI